MRRRVRLSSDKRFFSRHETFLVAVASHIDGTGRLRSTLSSARLARARGGSVEISPTHIKEQLNHAVLNTARSSLQRLTVGVGILVSPVNGSIRSIPMKLIVLMLPCVTVPTLARTGLLHRS